MAEAHAALLSSQIGRASCRHLGLQRAPRSLRGRLAIALDFLAPAAPPSSRARKHTTSCCCKDTLSRHYLIVLYLSPLHYIRSFRRRIHCFRNQAISTSLYTNSSRPAVDAMDSAETLARAAVLSKDRSDREQMKPHVRVADEVEQAGIGEEGLRDALRAERERVRERERGHVQVVER